MFKLYFLRRMSRRFKIKYGLYFIHNMLCFLLNLSITPLKSFKGSGFRVQSDSCTGQLGSESESDSRQNERFRTVQCSHLVYSLNWYSDPTVQISLITTTWVNHCKPFNIKYILPFRELIFLEDRSREYL